jgi:hypothetical protein
MDITELLLISVSAFAAVFVLLSILAVLMRLMLVVFPAREQQGETAVIAAVSTTIAALYPGTRTTRIEEIK